MEGRANTDGMKDTIQNYLKKEHDTIRRDTFISQQSKGWDTFAKKGSNRSANGARRSISSSKDF